ncbi:MAG: hydroxyacylglutathione hydrolase [Planctomycetota bacterium]
MNSVVTIPAFGDNYIYLCQYEQLSAFIVDPGDGRAALHALKEQGLDLAAVLTTHHHFDHIGGVNQLKRKTGCEIIGPDLHRIPSIDRVVKDGEVINLAGITIQIIATPGHTSTSVCYYVQLSNNRDGIVFTGDTLFRGGCGRLIECDANTMWDSLQKVAHLPDDTLVYPGHNYTEENYEFALTVEPNKDAVEKRLQEIRELQRQSKPTVPSTIAQEKESNIFLRADTHEVKAALNMPNAGAAETFAELRRRKDIFG